VDAS
jgi:alpha-tubulin suppressor-like RCC1 family protein